MLFLLSLALFEVDNSGDNEASRLGLAIDIEAIGEKDDEVDEVDEATEEGLCWMIDLGTVVLEALFGVVES